MRSPVTTDTNVQHSTEVRHELLTKPIQEASSQIARPRHLPALHQGAHRLGSLGNMDVFRMFLSPRNSITTRSSPMPPPPDSTKHSGAAQRRSSAAEQTHLYIRESAPAGTGVTNKKQDTKRPSRTTSSCIIARMRMAQLLRRWTARLSSPGSLKTKHTPPPYPQQMHGSGQLEQAHQKRAHSIQCVK